MKNLSVVASHTLTLTLLISYKVLINWMLVTNKHFYDLHAHIYDLVLTHASLLMLVLQF
jgi:hypothetical protein